MDLFRIRKIVPPAAFLLLLALPATSLAIPQKGQPAPALKVTTTTGQQVTLANYRGRVLILDFFASWCQPCRVSIPHLVELNRRYGAQGLQILGLSLDENSEDVKEFIAEKRINYPVALTDSDLQSDYGIRSVPTLYLVNKKGVIAEKFLGYSEETGKALEAAIKKLLAE